MFIQYNDVLNHKISKRGHDNDESSISIDHYVLPDLQKKIHKTFDRGNRRIHHFETVPTINTHSNQKISIRMYTLIAQ
jgi:hypothetical protein